MSASLVGSEMCIRDRCTSMQQGLRARSHHAGGGATVGTAPGPRMQTQSAVRQHKHQQAQTQHYIDTAWRAHAHTHTVVHTPAEIADIGANR
eukprot:4974482-Alexandrium_andersonii.AAC.1